jgi:hypothetical protein
LAFDAASSLHSAPNHWLFLPKTLLQKESNNTGGGGTKMEMAKGQNC